MLGVLVVAIAAAAAPDRTPDPSQLKSDLTKWDAAITEKGRYPIEWTEDELATLAKGEVVKRRSKLEGADRVFGAVWVPNSLAELWVGAQDPHWGLVDGLVEEELPGSNFHNKLVYQRIEAPWPFRDRQWVIRVVNNVALWKHTEGNVIERTWDLSSERGASVEDDKGVWVDVNEGGWFAATAAGGSVVGYHVRAVIGGNIPDDAASTWTMMTLGGMMRGLVEKSSATRSHYVAGHEPIRWPDGELIPSYP